MSSMTWILASFMTLLWTPASPMDAVVPATLESCAETPNCYPTLTRVAKPIRIVDTNEDGELVYDWDIQEFTEYRFTLSTEEYIRAIANARELKRRRARDDLGWWKREGQDLALIGGGGIVAGIALGLLFSLQFRSKENAHAGVLPTAQAHE